MSAPEFPGVSSPAVNLDGAVEVGLRVAWGLSSAALSPVNGVDLPQSNVSGGVGVVVQSIGVSSGFVGHDTLTAVLVP